MTYAYFPDSLKTISLGPDSRSQRRISTSFRRSRCVFSLYILIWSMPLSTAQTYLLSGVGTTQLTCGRKLRSATLPRPLWNTPSIRLPRRPSLWVCTTVTFPSCSTANTATPSSAIEYRYLPFKERAMWEELLTGMTFRSVRVPSSTFTSYK